MKTALAATGVLVAEWAGRKYVENFVSSAPTRTKGGLPIKGYKPEAIVRQEWITTGVVAGVGGVLNAFSSPWIKGIANGVLANAGVHVVSNVVRHNANSNRRLDRNLSRYYY